MLENNIDLTKKIKFQLEINFFNNSIAIFKPNIDLKNAFYIWKAKGLIMALPVLYEIAKDYKDALEELTDIEDEAVVDTLEGLKGTLETKSENIIKFTQNLNSTINAMKEAEKNMADRRKKLEKKVLGIKKYVKNVMEENQINKIETVNFDLTIRKNPPKAIIEDEQMIPKDYIDSQVIEKVNVNKVKEDLKKGTTVQGARLIQETRLDIK